MKEEYYKEFVCGYGAAVVSIGITFPVNKVIFRQMLHGVHARHAVEQLKVEGFSSLFRGILPPLLQKSFSMALMFGTFGQFHRAICRCVDCQTAAMKFAIVWPAAAASAGVECFLIPFERIQTLLQDHTYHGRFKNSFHAAKILYSSYGIKEFYRGFTSIYLRNSLSTGLFFSLREPIANRVLNSFKFRPHSLYDPSIVTTGKQKVSKDLLPIAAAHFASGGILGGVLSTVFYPVNVVRTRMQSYVGGEFHNVFFVWSMIRAERPSVLSMWRGVPLNFSRSLISWGIINASYELLKRVFFPPKQFSTS